MKIKAAEQSHMRAMQKNHNPQALKKDCYKINEVFYTIQGEGLYAGCAATFIRFSACNLACTWCDTEYDSGVFVDLPTLILTIRNKNPKTDLIVCTGGEPSLQMDKAFVEAFQAQGFRLTMETNGIKWDDSMLAFDIITASPKTVEGWWSNLNLWRASNPTTWWASKHLVLKVVYDPASADMVSIMEKACGIECRARFLQPLEDQDTGETNIKEVVAYIQEHPQWRLSLQTHKIMGLR